ncbi:hypothetical protein TIFTF001_009642 [Ficus carica]|uniref:Uncharacterized protein n=1 Tax=Ficus carica TaxID=3494 RepID=A0AA88AAR9_FICCA|nr:hypothetical protein TIFTF001_009642 [Ficus carica]
MEWGPAGGVVANVGGSQATLGRSPASEKIRVEWEEREGGWGGSRQGGGALGVPGAGDRWGAGGRERGEVREGGPGVAGDGVGVSDGGKVAGDGG